MCRLLGYAGPAIALERIITRPSHSLLKQSQHAHEAKLAVNGDGFGMAWYTGQDAEPGLYRDVLPAWSDGNLPSLCRVIRAPLFLAHVRAGTTGGTSRSNCHPFVSGRWSFAHNGQIAGFSELRRALEADLPDHLYALRQGTTDSEILFLTMLDEGLDDDPIGAVARAIARIERMQGGGAPNRITCVLADGSRIIGVRHSGDGHAPTLYVSAGVLDHGGRALASEPLDGCAANWTALPEGGVVILSADAMEISSLPGLADRAAA
ncbi:class II glutamine amidotransferase [Jannaschia pohangensis]|uniref:Glutamine amidotransferase n=1 Tax=Jannaschia pohangensis TaxID=390807 RepID=A0A1I3NN74_9RHOB|nr:class II glutamine amidotransferase [Jannaschia pohangensis]SFJ10754.1 glutamine amidotransferase [Jannaschia pohangensis]